MQRTPTCRNCCKNYSFQASPRQKSSNVPLLLDCAHTFCESCLIKLARSQKTHIICPNCETPTALAKEGEAGVKDLNVNVYIMGVLVTNLYKKSLLESPSPKKGKGKIKVPTDTGTPHLRKTKPSAAPDLKCEECFSASAVSRCVKCECVFCAKCFEKVHSMSHTLRKHKPLPLLSTSDDKSNGCPVHDNRPLEFYDKDENKPLCAHCVVYGEKEYTNVVPVAEVAEDIKSHLQENLTTGKSVLKHLEKSQQRIRQVLSQDLSEKTSVINEIREHFQLLSSSLQVRENALVRKIESSQCQEENLEVDIAERIRKTRNSLFELEHILQDPSTLINRAKEFNNAIQELQEMPCCAVKTQHEQQDMSRFSYDESYMDNIKTYGNVQDVTTTRLTMKKLSDVSEEDLNDDEEENNDSIQDDQSQGDAGELVTCGPRTHMARRILSIPYRHELVKVTHIRDPSSFVVQRLADMDQLSVLMNAIHNHCESAEPSDLVYEVNIGDVVCGQFSMDYHWYRARILSVYSSSHPNTLPTIENNLPVHVLYIDFGNSEWISMIRLRSMPTKFLHIPDLAVRCCLEDIVPPFQQPEWSPKTIKAFGSLTGSKPLLMTAIRRGAGGILHVDLKCPDDDEPTRDDDRPASVRDALVFLEVARFKSPASQISADGQLPFPMRVYKQPLPVDNLQSIDILVTHVNGPDDIYIQQIEEGASTELVRVMDEMHKMYSGKQKRKDLQVLWPYRGLVCGAQFSEDKAWYRALVLSVNSDETVDVNYVDYGNSERLPFSAIRKLPDLFLTLPQQARKAYLADIKPCYTEEWSDKVRLIMGDLLTGKSFHAQIIDTKDDIMSVVLYNDNTMKKPSLNDMLVKSYFANPAGLGIVQDRSEEDENSEADVKVEKVSDAEELSLDDNEIKPTEDSTKQTMSQTDTDQQSEKETDEKDEHSSTEQTEQKQKTEPSPQDEKGEPELEPSPLKESTEQSEQVSVDPKPLDGPGTSPEEQALESSSPKASNQTPSEPEVEPRLPQEGLGTSPPDREMLRYKPAEIPSSKQFQAGVTYVGMDGYIYVQEIKQDDTTLLDIMTRLHDKYKDSRKGSVLTTTNDVTIGQPCCAKFTADSMWYRAVITDKRSINHVEVEYIDFGNSEVVHVSSLRMDPPEIDVPKQCLKLQLYGVKPGNVDGRWSMKALSVMSQQLVGKNCSVLIEGDSKPADPIQVRLCPEGGKNIADTLLSLTLAKPLDGVRRLDDDIKVVPAGVKRGPHSKNDKRPGNNYPSKAETRLQAMLIGAREAVQILPNTQLPELNMPFDVIVTHVDQPDSLFIQRSPNCEEDDVYDVDPSLLDVEDELERLEEMAMNMNKPDYFKKYQPLTQASIGMLCCGMYTEDDTWYRGKVLSVECDNPLKALVRYIDYGNSEVLTGDRMRCFPSELLDLPIQATHCRLAHVRPPKTADQASEGSPWPDDSKEQLVELVVGKRLEARIVAFGNPISVELHDLSSGDNTNTNIAKTLAQQGHAIYKRKGNHDNDGNESLDTVSEGARSLCSNDVEIEEEEIIDNDSSCLEFKESELDVSASSKSKVSNVSKEGLLDKVLSAKSSFSPAIPLLTPNEFAMATPTADKQGDDVKVTKETESGSQDNEKTNMKSDDANTESEVD